MIGEWEKLSTPWTSFLMTPSSGESIGLAALRIMQVFQANRSSTFVWRGFPRAKRILCLRNRNTFESPLPNFPRDDRLEPRAIDNNKAPLPQTNDSARGEFD